MFNVCGIYIIFKSCIQMVDSFPPSCMLTGISNQSHVMKIFKPILCVYLVLFINFIMYKFCSFMSDAK